MSVILGAKTNDHIFIASDKRMLSSNGTFTDDNSKIFVVNEHLVYAGAGNVAFVDSVIKKLHASKMKAEMTTADTFEIAKKEYRLTKAACALRQLADRNFIDTSNSYCCFIAGINENNEDKLIFGFDNEQQGTLIENEVTTMIAPPEGMTSDQCFELLHRNYRADPFCFPHKTIKDIAKLSACVSDFGEVWIYNLANRVGKLKSF